MFFLLLVIIHLLICLITFLGIHSGSFRVHDYMFFVVVLLPFWGFLLLLLLHMQTVSGVEGDKRIGVEKLRVESELYKSINVDNKKITSTAVPMEEALLINSSAQRRQLILDVLNEDPKEYIEFLQKAGNNDDTEVVHYAVTALVEISKENDLILQRLENQYAKDPENIQFLQEYMDFLWECLSRGMMQGQIEAINRQLYSELMEKKLSIGGTVTDYERAVMNSLKQKKYTEASTTLEQMRLRYPDQEEFYLLKIQYFASLGRGTDIKKILEEVKEKHIFLSARGKEIVAFWED